MVVLRRTPQNTAGLRKEQIVPILSDTTSHLHGIDVLNLYKGMLVQEHAPFDWFKLAAATPPRTKSGSCLGWN
jgi:hypothetical protein